ncbi:probable endo-1,3(4)-beta-glucanase ARB_01444 [Arachis ipaensis]|uniref:probable endo-1,3(4)-beta-glucanase ARB_01444 n=1 Tax=Arachis ipaensis TaxID=130454 RepID=UPI0007AF4F41|nr:probable endo-1,3(4)-beta-glucanase ARB_01444 [Arachis ipaensis]
MQMQIMANITHLDDDEQPFLFPLTNSKVLPDPSKFFSKNLFSSALPTNSFFQNFVLNDGNNKEYIHPYLIKPSDSSLSICYPSLSVSSHSMHQVFTPDLTISSSTSSLSRHVISSFSDLSVTLDFPSSNLTFFLVRGSPYVTVSLSRNESLCITSIHSFSSFSSNGSPNKYSLKLGNGQNWLIYTSSLIKFSFSHDLKLTFSNNSSDGAPVMLRIAVIPDSSSKTEVVLDKYSSCYPLSGDVLFNKPYCVEYKWQKKGFGNLLMLAHPLHLQLLSKDEGNVNVLEHFKYRSIDGDLVGVVGDSWLLETDPVPVNWHSNRGLKEESYDEIKSALSKDVEDLDSSAITTTSTYFYGKLIARAARLALIGEEVGFLGVVAKVKKFLSETIDPWLNGTFNGNGFLYDEKWGGIVTKQGSTDPGAEFGFGVYNNHHYHLGYFLYGIAVLAKIDPKWGKKYKPQAYSIMSDFMNLGGGKAEHYHSTLNHYHYTRLRCFDLYKLHSWAGGLTEFADGRNQMGTNSNSEAVNIYYSAALMGLAYGDLHLASIGSTLASLEIHAAKMWWHVKEGDNLYEDDFAKDNKLVGYLAANHRLDLIRCYQSERECKIGFHVLPLLSITEFLFSNVDFVKDLVKWSPSLYTVGDGWMGFVYALEGIYNNKVALEKIRSLKRFDAGNTLSNLLWWIHSRHDYRKMGSCHEKQCCIG